MSAAVNERSSPEGTKRDESIRQAPTGSKDPQFGAACIDVDEWRDEPCATGMSTAFDGTDTKFSVYFPPAGALRGPVLPPGDADVGHRVRGVDRGAVRVAGSIEFAVDSGAYLVESNLGRTNPFPGEDWSLAGYRASAAVARYGRGSRRRCTATTAPTATSTAVAGDR